MGVSCSRVWACSERSDPPPPPQARRPARCWAAEVRLRRKRNEGQRGRQGSERAKKQNKRRNEMEEEDVKTKERGDKSKYLHLDIWKMTHAHI